MADSLIRSADGSVRSGTGRPLGFTKAKQAVFLDALARTANVRGASREAGVASRTAYSRRAADPGFAARWDAALVHAWDELERELLDMALNGYTRTLIHAGRSGDTLHDRDPKLMLTLHRSHSAHVAAIKSRTAPAPTVDHDSIRRRLRDKLALLADRLAEPLPPGLAAHEEGAGDRALTDEDKPAAETGA